MCSELDRSIPMTLLVGLLLLPSLSVAEVTPARNEEEVVIVTGTRIPRMDFDIPAPIDVFSRDELRRAGINTLSQFNRDLPYSQPAQFEFGGATGFNLRNLGVDATLTLFNGQRIAPFGSPSVDGDAFIDINSIPVAILERVEILKDGASAIYGADAIGGVVNLIPSREFNGWHLDAGYESDSEGDIPEAELTVAWGNAFGNSHLSVFASYYDREEMQSRDREHLRTEDLRDRGGFDERNFYSSPSTGLAIHPDYGFATGSLAEPGCPADRIDNTRFGPDFEMCVIDRVPLTSAINESNRLVAGVFASHDLATAWQLRSDLVFSQREHQRNAWWDAAAFVMSDAVRAALPSNPYPDEVEEVFYRFTDLPTPVEENEERSIAWFNGLGGHVGPWELNLQLNLAENEVDGNVGQRVVTDHLNAALEGRGGEDGTLTYDPFGEQLLTDDAVRDWLTLGADIKTTTQEAALRAEAWRELFDFGAAPVALALGTEWRYQSMEEDPDQSLLDNIFTNVRPWGDVIDEDRDILAAWAELRVEPLAGLELQLAIRHEDYSDFGTTTNPKLAAIWQADNGLFVRGSWSTSFLAPVFREIAEPEDVGSNVAAQFFEDVNRCDAYIEAGNEWRPDVCTAPDAELLSGGDPDLDPEEGESLNLGLGWEYEFSGGLGRLGIVLDYWDFEYTDRIVFLGGDETWENMEGTERIQRAPQNDEDLEIGAPGALLVFKTQYINAEKLMTSGFDLVSRWEEIETPLGLLGFGMSHTYVDEYQFEDERFDRDLGDDQVGMDGTPELRSRYEVTLQNGRHGFSATVRYTDSQQSGLNWVVDGEETDRKFKIDSQTELDLNYSLELERWGSLSMGCRNCTDEDPPVYNTGGGGPYYDDRGAVVYLRYDYSAF